MNVNGRREHAVALLGAGLAVGVVGLVGGGRVTPPLLRSLECVWNGGLSWAQVFFVTTLISSVITLTGIFGRWSGVKGLYIEAGGWLLQAAAWIGYGLVVLAKLGPSGLIFTLVVLCFSTAHIVRAVRIFTEARRVADAAAAVGMPLEGS